MRPANLISVDSIKQVAECGDISGTQRGRRTFAAESRCQAKASEDWEYLMCALVAVTGSATVYTYVVTSVSVQ
jgi:hypothetical protein